ncbi:hypothetical protein OPKNFCMD_4085 [Methylobacterium crusticola]|uniref:DUF1488 family protein n=1 Tax=Methylobacterium crusticola TaxID=1697972 RepID=A0ABQ4R118_9HYPH|nr:hypothetical protein [Methylobacterium crusticola]GJD51331.1 hypothetical protein OPKNFCMD_4085 [Methylobacterium crusticola]
MTDCSDVVRLFATPIGSARSRDDAALPITQTLYRTGDGRYVLRTCIRLSPEAATAACDVMIYDTEAALREALGADRGGSDDLDRALLAAADFGPGR